MQSVLLKRRMAYRAEYQHAHCGTSGTHDSRSVLECRKLRCGLKNNQVMNAGVRVRPQTYSQAITAEEAR